MKRPAGRIAPPPWSVLRWPALLASILLAPILLAGCGHEAPARPNLVLVTVDRMAADRLECFGGQDGDAASICALGRGGILFAWATTPGTGEASSAATVLTGLTPAEHGLDHRSERFLASIHESIAEELSRAGYATAAFVASPRLNRSRRLDQGFDVYDDRFASPSRRRIGERFDLPDTARDWIQTASAPWFVWIHADRDAGLAEIDRLMARLSESLDREPGRPGVLFAALRGERTRPAADMPEPAPGIAWRTHRVPLIWRPPPSAEAGPLPRVSRDLVSLLDIAPTLREAARLRPRPIARVGASTHPAGSPGQDSSGPARPSGSGSPATFVATAARESQLPLGRSLSRRVRVAGSPSPPRERFLLLQTHGRPSEAEVGVASQDHLYARRSSPLDGSGEPVPVSSLVTLGARFAAIPASDPPGHPAPLLTRLEPGPWRRDVLAPRSPVPRLEVHLARLLQRERRLDPPKEAE